MLAFFLDSHTPHYDLDDKKQLIWDMAEAMNQELRQLAASGCKVIQVAPYKNSLKKKIAVGVISHRTLQADFPEVIAGRIRECLKYIPADKLALSTDCGFGRQGFNRHLAFYKTVGIPLARNIVLRELGVEPRYVPAADERLAWDVLPDYEPFTHSPPLR